MSTPVPYLLILVVIIQTCTANTKDQYDDSLYSNNNENSPLYVQRRLANFRGEPVRFGKRAFREPIRFGKRSANVDVDEAAFMPDYRMF